MTDVDLGHALATFTHSAWRLEARDVYTIPSEGDAIRAWRAGERPCNEPWASLIRSHIVAGRQVGRVHAVTTPLTEYLRFEIAAYRASAEAGETIGIVDRAGHPELDVDFWIFDDRRVALMQYDDAGRFLGATDGTHELDHYRHLRDVALAAAVPLSDWTRALAS